ncbi:hypothetical protein H6F76_02115 [Leptolyngbya sp. FACHB-321]|nr:hypothetical protein [Leptolyngbya sp. FACHB-321]
MPVRFVSDSATTTGGAIQNRFPVPANTSP